MRVLSLIFFILLSVCVEAQVGYGPYGRQRSTVPRGPDRPAEEVKPKTAEELVEEFMPTVVEYVDLNAFEEAIVRSVLTKYVQKRIELRILELDRDSTREAMEQIKRDQEEELSQSLPPEKFQAFMELYEQGGKSKKAKRKKKKSKS